MNSTGQTRRNNPRTGIESSYKGQTLPEEETFSWAGMLPVGAGKTFRGDGKWGISAREMPFSDSPKFKLEEKKKRRKDLEATPILQSQVSSHHRTRCHVASFPKSSENRSHPQHSSREGFFSGGFLCLSRKALPTSTGAELPFVYSLVESSTTGGHVFFPVSENHMHFSEKMKAKNEMEDCQLPRSLSQQVETPSLLLLRG